jgi:hypothetical protein
MWLLGRLAPDHKTIAEFRRQNSSALVAVSAAFIQFARQARVIEGALVAIDGSKIRAVASKKALGRKVDLQRSHQAITEEVTDYCRVLRRPIRTKGARRQTVVQCRLP